MRPRADLGGFPPAPPGGYPPPPGGYAPPPGGYRPPPNAPPPNAPPPNAPPPHAPPPFGPPGGFGQPGGFPPPPVFGPPVPPPRKSGPGIGLAIGIGCGVLALLGIGGTLAAFFLLGKPEPVASEARPAATAAPVEPSATAQPVAEGKLELQDVRLFPARGSNAILYVVGELVNTGSVPLNAPRAKVTVFDASNAPLDNTTCGAFIVRDLQPNEKVPCFSVLSKATGWKTFKVESEFSKSLSNYRPADLKITDVESTSPRSVLGAHKVTGKITNQSNFGAKSVWVVVGLYDGNGKIVGSGKTLVAGNDLEPGASGKFTVSIYNVADHPKKSLTKVFGYDK